MGLFEGITHKEEIQNLLNEAQIVYSSAERRFSKQKDATSKTLQKLGKIKIEAWANDIDGFLSSFGAFKNVELVITDKNRKYHFVGENETPQKMLVNMQTGSVTAREIVKTGALSLGAGALVGIASYGGVMMFAHASTGTAIAALHGAAKTNAALAWFGGGSKALGGLGIKGGKLVLAGIVVLPVLAVAGVITAFKAKERLAEAREVNAKAKKAAKDLDIMTEAMAGINKMTENYISFLTSLGHKFKPLLAEMDRIAMDYDLSTKEKIDCDLLSEVEQKTLHISWLFVQVYYQALSMPLLSEEGDIHPQATLALKASNENYNAIASQIEELEQEKQNIKNALDGARSVFADAQTDLLNSIKSFNSATKKVSKGRLFSIKQAGVFVDAISGFDNIELGQERLVSPKKLEDEFSAITEWNSSSQSEQPKALAFFGFGSQLTDTDVDDSLLFDIQPIVEDMTSILNAITGKESLAISESIYVNVKNDASQIEKSTQRINDITRSAKALKRQIKKAGLNFKTIAKRINKVFKKNYGGQGCISFDSLDVYSQQTIVTSCELFNINFELTTLPLHSNGISVDQSIKELKKQNRKLKNKQLVLSIKKFFKREKVK